MARTLKVFSADLGFVRAVVATGSRKAALEAWGVRDDLFARGSAREITDDDALMAEARAAPGEVLRKPIGSGADLVAAATKPTAMGPAQAAAPKPPAKPKKTTPPPSRDALEAADAALDAAKAERAQAMTDFDAEQADLDRRREAAAAKLHKAIDAKARVQSAARAAYDKALKAWSG